MLFDLITLGFAVILFTYLGYHTVQGVRQSKVQNKVNEEAFEEEIRKKYEAKENE